MWTGGGSTPRRDFDGIDESGRHEGRHAAPPGTKAAEGELSPAEIDQHIDANRGALIGFAKALRATAQKALTAIDKKDVQGLFEAGSDIDEACEACHVILLVPEPESAPDLKSAGHFGRATVLLTCPLSVRVNIALTLAMAFDCRPHVRNRPSLPACGTHPRERSFWSFRPVAEAVRLPLSSAPAVAGSRRSR